MQGRIDLSSQSSHLTTDQKDVLSEILNIGIGQAANILNQMVESHISLSLPFVDLCSSTDLINAVDYSKSEQLALIQLPFSGKITGTASLVLPAESASRLISVITKDERTELDSIQSGTLAEIGNIMLNGVMGSLGNILDEQLLYQVPSFYRDNFSDFIGKIANSDKKMVLIMRTRFFVAKYTIEGDVIIFFELEGYKNLIMAIDGLIDASDR